MATDSKARKAIYNPEAERKWREGNREHSNYLSGRSAARSFIRNLATREDLDELKKIIEEREENM